MRHCPNTIQRINPKPLKLLINLEMTHENAALQDNRLADCLTLVVTPLLGSLVCAHHPLEQKAILAVSQERAPLLSQQP
jgi:hypothetical protein